MAMYASRDFKSKKAFKEAVAAGEKITLYPPGLGEPNPNGSNAVEGPHYPKPHTWYGTAVCKDGVVVSVK